MFPLFRNTISFVEYVISRIRRLLYCEKFLSPLMDEKVPADLYRSNQRIKSEDGSSESELSETKCYLNGKYRDTMQYTSE